MDIFVEEMEDKFEVWICVNIQKRYKEKKMLPNIYFKYYQ